MKYIIDSYAWVEYFLGSAKGMLLKKLFDNVRDEFFTIECCLAEIVGWALKNNKDERALFEIIRANSQVLSITEENWVAAGKERFVQRKEQGDFGLIDATLVVKQKEFSCKIISGDKHFKNLKNIIFMK